MEFSPNFYWNFACFEDFCHCKKKIKLTLVFLCVITLSKFVPQYFDNVIMQFIINKSTDTLQTRVNLLKGPHGCPVENNMGNSFEIYPDVPNRSVPNLNFFWLISNKIYILLIRCQWVAQDCLFIFNPSYRCARMKVQFSLCKQEQLMS